jgi:hypothetical protein
MATSLTQPAHACRSDQRSHLYSEPVCTVVESDEGSYARTMTSTARLTQDGRSATLSSLAFRRTRLNPVGWVAVLAPGWLAGVTVALVTSKGKPDVGRVLACAVGGAAACVLIARGIDEIRWRSTALSLDVGEPDAALDLMQAVRAEGVQADMVRADHAPYSPAYAVRYRAKDDRRVRAVLAEQQG